MKILVKAIAGSHLFGTNTPSSDMDYKGIFLPEASDILLGKFNQVIHDHTNNSGNKNTKDDIDIEFYSLDKFLTMLYQGQTVAWELLFTPDSMILEKHPLWDEIRAAAPLLVNKRVDAFVGYCKQQSHKYGTRGSRLNSLEIVLSYLDTNVDHGDNRLREVDLSPLLNLEHVEMIKDTNGKELFVVCGKKFGLDTPVSYVEKPLKLYYDTYGERSKQARLNQNVDWKALSHAVRVCMQAISLLNTGKIMLPMHPSQVTLLKGIKKGDLTFDVVSNLIEEYQEDMLRARDESTLPAEPNLAEFQKIQTRIYGMIVKGEV
jgi:hypothetical protein